MPVKASNRARSGDRESAAGLLVGRLPERLLQARRVGRDGAGAVDQERAQAVPQAGVRPVGGLAGGGGSGLAQGDGTVAQQGLHGRQRQPHACLAVGRGAEDLAGQQAQVVHGGVARHDLKDEQVEGLDGSELPLAPGVAGRPARCENRFIGQEFGQVGLDAFESLRDSHPWPPWGLGPVTKATIAEAGTERECDSSLLHGSPYEKPSS
jgi:hypothetical protein